MCLLRLSALSFDNAPRNISDNRVTGFCLSGSSTKVNVTSICLPINEDGTDKDTFDSRGIIIVLVIILYDKMYSKFIQNFQDFQKRQ